MPLLPIRAPSSAFYFGGFWNYANGSVGMGMITQYYEDFQPVPPPASTWDIPASCSNAVACTNWPLLRDAQHPLIRPAH